MQNLHIRTEHNLITSIKLANIQWYQLGEMTKHGEF